LRAPSEQAAPMPGEANHPRRAQRIPLPAAFIANALLSPCRLSANRNPGRTATAIEAAMEELVSLAREYCGGEVSWSLLDPEHLWAVME
jgi:hypothetical protein